MSKKVYSLNVKDSFDKAVRLFKAKDIHQIPVLDHQDKLVGIIYKSDFHLLCDRYTSFNQALGDSINRPYFKCLPVIEVMHQNPISLHAWDMVETALSWFKKYPHKAIPIVNGTKNLIGMLSISDVINWICAQHEEKNTFHYNYN